jgi:hypothetical protein
MHYRLTYESAWFRAAISKPSVASAGARHSKFAAEADTVCEESAPGAPAVQRRIGVEIDDLDIAEVLLDRPLPTVAHIFLIIDFIWVGPVDRYLGVLIDVIDIDVIHDI